MKSLTSWKSWPERDKLKLRDRLRAEVARRGLDLPPDATGALQESDWRAWLCAKFPAYVKYPFAPRHQEFWEWVWSIERERRPQPFIALWPRGGAKSTSAELACVAVEQRRARPYAIYVCETQEQSDQHVQTVGSLLEASGVGRAVNKYGSSKGWRRDQLRTAGGFTLDALGLDTAARGIKIDENRPGLMIFDDIDGKHDSPKITKKKMEVMTHTILPAGTAECAVLFVQNLIHANSIASRLADSRADFLIDRKVSGPFKAIEDLQTREYYDEALGRVRNVIVGGTPTWEGQSIAACQAIIDRDSLQAFLEESQHEVEERKGALWTRATIPHLANAPLLTRVVVGVDPKTGEANSGSETGIIVAGRDARGRAYVLHDASIDDLPDAWGQAVLDSYNQQRADLIIGETNNGGEMVAFVVGTVAQNQGQFVPFRAVHASRGKVTRAEPVQALYKQGRVFHVGTFADLELQMRTWLPGMPSPDRLDALVWAIWALLIEPEAQEQEEAEEEERFSISPL